MSTSVIDPGFASALRDCLTVLVRNAPRHRRKRRWQLGLGALVASTALAGSAAFAAGVFSQQPGAPKDTPLSSIVSVTRSGTSTVELGAAPAAATNISLTLTCLSPGTFGYPDGSSMSCTSADLAQPYPVTQQSSEVVPLRPGADSVTITASPNAAWTLQAVYINRVVTPWATNANGQTYGVPNKLGSPDLIAVTIDGGMKQGYIKASDEACASGWGEVHSPKEALAWDEEKKQRNVSIPVYANDGTTVLGSFIVGDASGPGSYTESVSSLYASCSAGGHS